MKESYNIRITNRNSRICINLPDVSSLELIPISFPRRIPKYNNGKILDDSIKQEKGVYLLFNKKKVLLYVGRTIVLRNRLLQHISPRVNRENYFGRNLSNVPLGIIKYFSFIKTENKYQRNIIEKIYINLFKPKYNTIR